MFKCGQEIYVINICPLPFGFCKSTTFFTGSLFPRAVSEFIRGFSDGKIRTRASVCVSYLEICDLEKTLMLLERIVTTCIRLKTADVVMCKLCGGGEELEVRK